MRARRLHQDQETKRQDIVWFGSYGVVPAEATLEAANGKDPWSDIMQSGSWYYYEAYINPWVGVSDPGKEIIAEVDASNYKMLKVEFTGIKGNSIEKVTLSSGSSTNMITMGVNGLAQVASAYDAVTEFKIIVQVYNQTFPKPRVTYYAKGSAFVQARAKWGDASTYVTPSYADTQAYDYSSEQESVKDGLTPRLSVIKGELWYKKSYGLPLMEKIKSKGIYDAIITSYIEDYPDVASLVSFTSSLEGHSYTYDAVLLTTWGDAVSVSS